jgi:hypothetical protein
MVPRSALGTSLALLLCMVAPAGTHAADGGPKVTLYGFVKADVIYDVARMNPAWNSVMRPSQIVIRRGDTPHYDDGEIVFSLRGTRVGLDLEQDAPAGPIRGRVEIDFLGTGTNAGQQLPRLRQAYVAYGRFLAGQAWSLFNDTDVWPLTMDFWGPCGLLASRRPQLRWTPRDDGNRRFAVALEQPGAGIEAGKGPQYDPVLDVRPRSELPDLTVQYRRAGRHGHLQLAGVARALGYEGTFAAGADTVTYEDSEFGWGFYLSGRRAVGRRDGLAAAVYHGRGIANYANDGGVDVGPDAGLRAESLPLTGWMAAYEHWWNGSWSSGVGASQTHQRNGAGQDEDSFRRGTYAFANVVHHVQGVLTWGVEFLWGERHDKDGMSNDAFRLQFSARYAF